MPKKISIYTAFGQFIEMIETTNQVQEETQKDTDKWLCDFFTLSDYQQNLSTLQIQTCPTIVYDKADYSLCEIRKIKSCPNFVLPTTIKWQIPMALSSTDSSYFLNLTTPAMLQYWEDIQSPIPTTIESRKLNDATSDMISFWKIHVQSRRKPSTQQSEPNIIDQISTEYFVPTPINPSIFEKLNGVFENTYKSPITSWYQDMQRLFEESPDVFTSSFLENFNQFFSPKSEEKDEWPIGPLQKDSTANHSLNCLCYNCWRMSAYTKTVPIKTENVLSYSSNAPTLPVFVKSPVDSLNLYKGGKISEIDSGIDSDNVSTSGNQADAEDSDSNSEDTLDFSSDSESTRSSTLEFYIKENELLNEKTRIQKGIIRKFMALLDIDDALIKLRDE